MIEESGRDLKTKTVLGNKTVCAATNVMRTQCRAGTAEQRSFLVGKTIFPVKNYKHDPSTTLLRILKFTYMDA